MSEYVRLRIRDGVAHLEMARGTHSNSFDLETAHAFDAAVRAIERSEETRVVLVSGEGKRFSAGGDVTSMAAAEDRGGFIHNLAEVLDGALQRLDALPKPVVVAVQGAVAGAGLGVMLAGDIIVADRATKFLTAYASVGLTPDCGVSWLLPRAVGQQRALRMALMSEPIDGEKALEWGLVTDLVDGDPRDGARELAVRLASGPAEALGQTRRLLRSSWTVDRATSGADEARTIARSVVTAEASALIARFVSR